MSEIRYAPPAGHMLESKANANLSWKQALGEWIDNSLDAGARTISFDFSVKNELKIVDDGYGCADPEAMIQLGSTKASPNTKLGRYGIGGKDAAIWVGGLDSSITITTVHAGIRRGLNLNWRDHANNGWSYVSHDLTEAGDERGTHIRIQSGKTRRAFPTGEPLRKLLDDLGYIFAPAIKDGRLIRFRSKPGDWVALSRWELPDLEPEYVHERIEIDGKGALVHCGIVSGDQPNPRAGFTYWHGWRVIEAASPHGCGQHSAKRICGVVELDRHWRLTTHKDAISGGAEELYEEVERVCLPLLKRGEQIGSSLESEEFRTQIASMVNEFINATCDAKSRRQPKKTGGEPQPGARPTGTGGKHQRAAVEQPGARFPGRQGRRFEIDFKNWGQPEPIGEIKSHRVILNDDNPALVQARKDNNSQAIVWLVVCLISSEHCLAPGRQFSLPGLGASTPHEFANVVGRLLAARDLTIASKPILALVS